MDPDAAYKAMHDQTHTATERRGFAAVLIDWLDRGGFPPAGRTADLARSEAAHIIRTNPRRP